MKIKQCKNCGNIYGNGTTYCPVCESTAHFILNVTLEGGN